MRAQYKNSMLDLDYLVRERLPEYAVHKVAKSDEILIGISNNPLRISSNHEITEVHRISHEYLSTDYTKLYTISSHSSNTQQENHHPAYE